MLNYGKKIDRAEIQMLELTLHEIEYFRNKLTNRDLGLFYFNRACYDSALLYLQKASKEADIPLINICRYRLGESDLNTSLLDVLKSSKTLKILVWPADHSSCHIRRNATSGCLLNIPFYALFLFK